MIMVQIKFSIEDDVEKTLLEEHERRGGGSFAPLLREVFMAGFGMWRARQLNRQEIEAKRQLLESLETK